MIINKSRWINWVGNQTCEPARIETATDEEQISEAIVQARAAQQVIRTYGTGHSFAPIVSTDGVILDTKSLRGIVNIDPVAKTVTAKAQTPIADLGAPLLDAGLALKNQGDIDTQTLIGAISTATHGSGLAFRSFSGEMVACQLIDGEGKLRQYSLAEHPEMKNEKSLIS